ncbi:hypothetical protein, partial [Streptomyces malaysiensis]|uniref:hypothetical protein n=1 Tax=Streptomyces malaysiensis TaxID=92644 RepID=UPI001F21909C
MTAAGCASARPAAVVCAPSALLRGVRRATGADEGRRRAQLTGRGADRAAWDAAVGGWVGG